MSNRYIVNEAMALVALTEGEVAKVSVKTKLA